MPEVKEAEDSDFDRESLSFEAGPVAVWSKSIKPTKRTKMFMFGRTSQGKKKIVDQEEQETDQLGYLIRQMKQNPLLRELIQHEVVLAVLNST